MRRAMIAAEIATLKNGSNQHRKEGSSRDEPSPEQAAKTPPRVIVVEWQPRCRKCLDKRHRCFRCLRARREKAAA